jgi:hypothetical protein
MVATIFVVVTHTNCEQVWFVSRSEREAFEFFNEFNYFAHAREPANVFLVGILLGVPLEGVLGGGILAHKEAKLVKT